MKTTKKSTISSTEASAFITKNRSRLKIYKNNVIYLNDGDNFEIELFNPLPEKLGIRVRFDNADISKELLIIRPGERYYLNCFYDDSNKPLFKFSTYSVVDSKETKNAIKFNGDVEISFFKEDSISFINGLLDNIRRYYIYIPYYPQPYYQQPYYYSPYTMSPLENYPIKTVGNYTTCNSLETLNITNTTYSASETIVSSNLLDTGRIEKDTKSSKEDFQNTIFESQKQTFYTIKYKLLPNTLADKKIKRYCKCGARIRQDNWKVCPICTTLI